MKLGRLILFGSGETSPHAQPIYDDVMGTIEPPVRVGVLETPAGFQLNSASVAGAVADFVRQHLQNYKPEITIIPARRRHTPFSPDNPEVVSPLLTSKMIFLGPGSPTYTVRQLKDSLAWHVLQARHRLGHALVMASAATIASSVWALPVYEIYKVGEDPHWKPGLDFWRPFGLSVVFVPHWNNNEGGAKHDTSRCFMGKSRFRQMLHLLPEGITIVGIDEHSAILMDAEKGICMARGHGGVTLIREGRQQYFERGATFPFTELGSLRLPAMTDGIPGMVWEMVHAAEQELRAKERPPAAVKALVQERELARSQLDWAHADFVRERIEAMGWHIRDTPDGPRLARID